jgi:hypothetical protein
MAKRRLSVFQWVLGGCILGVLIFVGTYIKVNLGQGPGKAQAEPSAPANLTLLTFEVTKWPVAELGAPERPAVTEVSVEGHHEFWFENPTNGPVQVWLYHKNCKCTKVELAVLPDELKGLSKAELDRHANDPKLDWHILGPDDTKGVTVPAHAAGGVRMNWKRDTVGPEKLVAELRNETGTTSGEPIDLYVSLDVVPALLVGPENNLNQPPQNTELQVETMYSGDTRTLSLICWSATRSRFGLKAEPTGDACVECGKPQPLGKDERERLGKRDGKPVLCGYRIPVTLRERTEDGKQFDLGRFRRHLKFTSDAGVEPATVTLAGFVRGEVTVGTPDDHDMVLLGSFERKDGKTKSIPLTTPEANLNLTLEGVAVDEAIEKSSDFLQVKLDEETAQGQLGKVWTLTVTVPPDTLAGEVPRRTAIVLKTSGEHARRIKIPVVGNAYVR